MNANYMMVSFKVTRAESAQLQRLTATLVESRSEVIRRAIRELAEREGIPTLDAIRPAYDRALPPEELRETHVPIDPPKKEYTT